MINYERVLGYLDGNYEIVSKNSERSPSLIHVWCVKLKNY